MVQGAGPGYKAAMAMMFLADDKPEDEKADIWKEAEPATAEPDLMAPSALANLDLQYQSPFPEKKPVRMAGGGEAKKMLEELPDIEDTSETPFDIIRAGSKMNVEDKQIENMMLGLGTSSSSLGLNLSKMKQGEKENLAQNLMAAYRTKVGDTDVSVMGMRPTGAPAGTYMGNVSAAIPVYGNDRLIIGANGMQSPYQSGMTGVNLGYSGQVGPGRLDAMMMQPVNSSQGRSYQVQYRLPVGRAEGSPMGGENADHLTPQEIEQIAMAQAPAFGVFPQMQPYRSKQDREASANVPVDVARGRLAGTFGLFGDVANQPIPMVRPLQLLSQALTGQQKYPDTEYFLENLPLKSDTPVGTAVGKAASFVPLNPAPVVNAITRTAEKVGGKAAEMLSALKGTRETPKAARVEPAPEMEPAVQTELSQLNLDRQYPRDYTQPPNPWMGVAPTVEEARANVAARQAAERATPPPAVPEVAPVAPPVEVGVPADRPFVGRLDAFVDTLKGPVQLGQLKNQLKGKFRDYDLERIERAFANYEDNAKLTPDQIKKALANTHSPSSWLSETLPVKAGNYHQGVDNVWGSPLGSTNLYLEQTPEKVAAGDLFNKATKNLSPFVTNSPTYPTPKHLEEARNLLNDPQLTSLVPPQLVTNLQTKFDKVERNIGLVQELQGEVKNIENGLAYPVLYKDPVAAQGAHGDQPWFRFKNEVVDQRKLEIEQQLLAQGDSAQYRGFYDYLNAGNNREALNNEAERIASQKVQQLALERARQNGIPEPDVSLIDWNTANSMNPATGNPAFTESIKNALEPSIHTIHEAAKNIQRVVSDDVKKIGDVLLKGKMYQGKPPHVNITGKPYPVGFTRFSEHEATIPDVGVVQGRHFHELQSDLSNDMRKYGTTSGNAAKDQAEYNKLQGELRQAQQKAMDKLESLQAQKRALPQTEGFNVADLTRIEEEEKATRKAFEKGTQAMEKRISILGTRIRDKAPYSLEEPFAGFETNQMVRQQLLMKNAIQSAMRDGMRFATFPGAESRYPNLYVDKVRPNLKQVIKDLGGEKSGLELRQIELPPDKDGNPITATGVVWSPEAAARIMKTGVPFAKGGSVEKSNTDYRAYI
jgi:hypothetical protein